ncbi:protein kinase domain-containing protein [Deinococcus sp.]|uniref:protein kinase domain-containing protein n=1 Tax=Deinococcus sp. TaxID=47478 RepID=UPI002869C654|nr:protein kinase [Deinococcus sp.]
MTSTTCPVCASPVAATDTVCRTCGAPLTPGAASAAAKAVTAALALPAGCTLGGGQYVLSRVLGRGGFGITYDAQDVRLGLRVAIKELFVDGSQRRVTAVIPPGNLSTAEFQETKRRFLDEAKVLARFNDPGIVRVLNYFEENGTAYLVMEFLEGMTLGGAIEKNGPLPPAVALEVARSLTRTLEQVHGAGLLHRDIKPDNIFMHKSGRIVLIDFGSVRAYTPGQTVSHTRLVTPGYAPLEQYGNSARYGPYTDIYSLGATLHHALTGQMPPPATDLMLGTPLPPLPPGTPAPLRRAIENSMALRVEDRPQTARALEELLVGPAQATAAPAPRLAPAARPTPAARPAPPVPSPRPQPQPQTAPAPRPQSQPAPVSRPAPTPAPAARPQAQPAPAPAAPRPAPAPVVAPAPVTATPRPVPQPAPPNIPLPPRRNPLPRTLLVALCIGLGGVTGLAQLPALLPAIGQLGPVGLVVAGVIGAAVGFVAGQLAWLALPVALPLGTAALAVLYANGVALHWPTVAALGVMAAVISIFILRAIRRVSF